MAVENTLSTAVWVYWKCKYLLHHLKQLVSLAGSQVLIGACLWPTRKELAFPNKVSKPDVLEALRSLWEQRRERCLLQDIARFWEKARALSFDFGARKLSCYDSERNSAKEAQRVVVSQERASEQLLSFKLEFMVSLRPNPALPTQTSLPLKPINSIGVLPRKNSGLQLSNLITRPVVLNRCESRVLKEE